jgi:hypothetical protein
MQKLVNLNQNNKELLQNLNCFSLNEPYPNNAEIISSDPIIMQQMLVNLKTNLILKLYFEFVKFFFFFLNKHVLKVEVKQQHQLQFQQLLNLFDKFYLHNKIRNSTCLK